MGNVAGTLTYSTKLDTEGFKDGVDKFSSTAVTIGNLMADVVKKVASTVVDVVKTGVNYNAQIEQYQTALTTLTGSAEKAQQIISNIKEDAAKTPFDVSGLTQANQLLISAGIDSDKARKDVLNLGNAIAATGGGNEELSRMAVNLQQIKNVGKASALDIKQFAYAGIDVYGLLADYMGIARDEATEMQITYEDLTGALAYASEEGGKYYGAMENQSQTLNGQWSTLKDNLNAFAGQAAEPLFNFLKETALPIINDLLTGGEKVKKWLKENETPLTLLAIVIGTITTAILAYTIAQNAAAIATTIATAASTAFGAIMAFITSPITLVVLAIGALIAIGYLLVKNWDTIKEKAIKIFNYIKEFFSNIINSIKEKISNFVESIKDFGTRIVNKIKEAASKVYEGIKNFVSNIINKVKDGFTKVTDIGKNIVEGLWNGIKNAKDWLLDKIKSFAKTITDGIKKFFGIKSPSRVMRDQVGQWLPKGIAVGIDENTDSIDDAIDEMNEKMYDKMADAVNIETGKMSFSGVSGSVNQILSANGTFEGNINVVTELDGEVVYENQQKVTARKNLQYS